MVSITGTNFTGTSYTTSAVAFGGTAAASFTVNSATSITATVGSGATGAVTVTTPGGTANSSTTFTFIPAPTITGFSPASAGAGTVVTITGTNFTGTSAVTFGGTPATSFSVSAGTISAIVASGTSGAITVTTPGGTVTSSSAFGVISPNSYTVVTTDTPQYYNASMGGYEMGMMFSSSTDGQITQIRYYEAAGETGTHIGRIWSLVGTLLANVPFTDQTGSGWQYATLTTPLSIIANTYYIVSVNINTKCCYSADFLIENGPLTGYYSEVNYTAGLFPNLFNGYNFFRDIVFTPAAPTITSFTPANGGTGTVLTITGTYFTGATAVAVGGTAAASFTVTNDTTISATVGNGATGTLTVTTPAGTATSSGSFTYYPTPAISGFTPTSAGAGMVVTISGAHFTGVTAVAFGGTAATSYTFVNDSTITAVVASGASGTITVTNPGGTGTSTGTFTFISAPTISGFTPAGGGAGTVVTISGANLSGTTAVTFCGTPAASFTINNAGSITATVANGSSGPIAVTTPEGTAYSSSIFTFTSPNLYSVMTTQTPQTSGATGEWGMDFTSSANGQITQICYYEPEGETGPHTGNLWSADGTLLASVPFIGETGSGWQYATLATPLTITPGTDYIVSVNCNMLLCYSDEIHIMNGPLDDECGEMSDTPGTFPQTATGWNYFRDIVFSVPAPTISSFNLTSGGAGTVVTITGNNFDGVTAVNFGGTPAATFSLNSNTAINATVGNGASGTITVTTPGGTASSSGTFTFIPAPTITSFALASGNGGRDSRDHYRDQLHRTFPRWPLAARRRLRSPSTAPPRSAQRWAAAPPAPSPSPPPAAPPPVAAPSPSSRRRPSAGSL